MTFQKSGERALGRGKDGGRAGQRGTRLGGDATAGSWGVEPVARAFSDPYARLVLAACLDRAKPVKVISAETGLPLPTTYRHVKRLRGSGLIEVERCALTPDGKPYSLYRTRVRSAAIGLDGPGGRVTCLPNGMPADRAIAGIQDPARGAAAVGP